MMVFDELGNKLESYDLSKGKMIRMRTGVQCSWIVDKNAVGHYEVLKEYDNGGKDVTFVVDDEEEGHWDIVIENGYENDYHVNENIVHQSFCDTWDYQVYIPYSQEELDEIEIENANQERINSELEQSVIFNESLPGIIAELDEAICTLYELTIGE